MKKDILDNRAGLAEHRFKIPDAKLSMGSTMGKYPVVLSDGKTVIYISDKSKEAETRSKYERMVKSRSASHPNKTKVPAL